MRLDQLGPFLPCTQTEEAPPLIPHLSAATPHPLLPEPMADITNGSQHSSRAQISLSADQGWHGREAKLSTGRAQRPNGIIHQILVKNPRVICQFSFSYEMQFTHG